MSRDANKLKNFQESLNQRIRDAAALPQRQSRLAVVAGERGYLLDLDDIAEVVPLEDITPVPLTKPWFLGVANVRGSLYAVSDFAEWLGLHAAPTAQNRRLVLFGHRLAAHRMGIVVSRVAGLRLVDDMERVERRFEHDWEVAAWHDSDGLTWVELDLSKLAADPSLMQVLNHQ